jgi:hypothetical protein
LSRNSTTGMSSARKRPRATWQRSDADRNRASVPSAAKIPTPLSRCMHIRRSASSAVTVPGASVMRTPSGVFVRNSEFSDEVVDGEGGTSAAL